MLFWYMPTPTPTRIIMIAITIISSDRKSTRLNSSHVAISYAVFCLKKKNWDGGDDGSRRPRELVQQRGLPHVGVAYDGDPDFSRQRIAVFCFIDTATTEIYTLSLHDALPI